MAYQNKPYVRRETQGTKVVWCSCGESANAPYCDGSHKTKKTGKLPRIVVIPDSRILAWCGCGKTCNAPFCDASHKDAR